MTSKTGLLPSVRKNVKHQLPVRSETITMEMPKIVVPAPFTLRPFAGVYNPFPYGCSILCNHPADFEAKSTVKKAREAWAAEGKSLIDLEEVCTARCREKTSRQQRSLGIIEDQDQDRVPEELFRKYTDTDSRPITPAPTLVSITTKTSQNLRTRRCMTPDPTSFIPTKEKTMLVLDLRRSHSQETVCWQGGHGSEACFEGAALPEANASRTTSPSSQGASQPKKKRTARKKTAASDTVSSLRTQTSRESDSKVHTQHSSASQSPSKGSLILDQETANNKIPEISPQSSSGDLHVVKRRGKKRKGKKAGKDGLKEFQGIPDPGETQVSAMENDSKEGSSSPSLVGDERPPENPSEQVLSANLEPKPESDQEIKSFLNRAILKQLQRQLDQEVVDSELNAKRRIALEEALRHRVNLKHAQQGEEMKNLKKEFQLLIKDSDKWLSIPRVFTRRSARFELPMDSRLLSSMTPLQYVQKYVYASPERLVLYGHVFNLHKEEPDDDDDTDRILLGENVVRALGKIMGREMTSAEGEEFQNLLGWEDAAGLDFRTFAGIAATCERFMGPRFCSSMPSQEEDPRHEVERADFETLEGKLLRVHPDRRLVKILKSIRDL